MMPSLSLSSDINRIPYCNVLEESTLRNSFNISFPLASTAGKLHIPECYYMWIPYLCIYQSETLPTLLAADSHLPERPSSALHIRRAFPAGRNNFFLQIISSTHKIFIPSKKSCEHINTIWKKCCPEFVPSNLTIQM